MRLHLSLVAALVSALTIGLGSGRLAAQNLPAPRPEAGSVGARFQAENVAPAFAPSQPLFVLSPPPESRPSQHRSWKKAWIASWVAFAVINALDVHSSMGRAEANPLLRSANGNFSGKRAALVKSGAGAGFLAVQWWVGRKNPERYRLFTITNTALDGGLAAIVVRNYGLGGSQATAAPDYVLRPTE